VDSIFLGNWVEADWVVGGEDTTIKNNTNKKGGTFMAVFAPYCDIFS